MSTIITNENKSPYFETNSFLQFGNCEKSDKKWTKIWKKVIRFENKCTGIENSDKQWK